MFINKNAQILNLLYMLLKHYLQAFLDYKHPFNLFLLFDMCLLQSHAIRYVSNHDDLFVFAVNFDISLGQDNCSVIDAFLSFSLR